MRRVLAVAAIVVVALALPSIAGAFTGWHWSVGTAQKTIKREGIRWSNQNGRDLVTNARCVGIGEPWDDNGSILYARFRCLIKAINPNGENQRYYVRIKVTGKNTFVATFVRYV